MLRSNVLRLLPGPIVLFVLVAGCRTGLPPEPAPTGSLPILWVGTGLGLPEPVLPESAGAPPAAEAAEDAEAAPAAEAPPGIPVRKISGWKSSSRRDGSHGFGMRRASPRPAVAVVSAAGSEAGPAWPAYGQELEGPFTVRIVNQNDFEIRVGIRSGGAGRDLTVPAADQGEVMLPTGRYEIFFRYAVDPGGLYQGSSFSLDGPGIEIHVMESREGVPSARRVD